SRHHAPCPLLASPRCLYKYINAPPPPLSLETFFSFLVFSFLFSDCTVLHLFISVFSSGNICSLSLSLSLSPLLSLFSSVYFFSFSSLSPPSPPFFLSLSPSPSLSLSLPLSLSLSLSLS